MNYSTFSQDKILLLFETKLRRRRDSFLLLSITAVTSSSP